MKRVESKILEIAKRIELKILKVAKFTFFVVDIEYFDATFACDIQKFNLFCEIVDFLQHLRQCQHQYRESNLLILLFECLREPCIDLIQKTKKRKRHRQKEIKRVIKSFDFCIFCEISFEIRNLCSKFVCFFFFVAISLVRAMLRILLVIDTTFATYSESRLSKCDLQAMRRSIRFEE